MSVAAYKNNIRETENPRDIERRILLRIAGEMDRSASDYDHAQDQSERLRILSEGLRETLAENIMFWSALKLDLADPNNQLPPDLRAALISLALWVERQSNAVIGGEKGVAALVSTNRAIAAGLAGQTPGPRAEEN
ncbi:flagellar biosynthesis regulator FlaF [Roseibacterium sp. SDUM158016]|uniref:flagellar biosynthesis regulator FlaF n=1 Tax=Roseicyclus sediminis TaxID=2980997 RepID=UPI0021CE959D|nr:flagellar biosynthesis regulator FlaF [Roseibacterium sp. SDUM158016]MCU4654327.1 flagellar biosynthesis regulator FlaF [Roseibacterium sp. SDUM158016]